MPNDEDWTPLVMWVLSLVIGIVGVAAAIVVASRGPWDGMF